MESFGNERQVQQGEDWNLDLLLSSSNVEYIPYIISNQRTNPFFVVTVASTKYEKNLRYVKSWWNSAKTYTDSLGNTVETPTFYQTVPQWYGDVASTAALPSAASSDPTNPTYGDNTDDGRGGKAPKRLLYQYTLTSEDVDITVGHKPYHYFYFNYTYNSTTSTWVQSGSRVDTYECHVRQNFSSAETAKWNGQNYLYQVTLVTGQLMAARLTAIHDYHVNVLHEEVEDWPTTTTEQYYYVKANWPDELQPDIDVDSPIGYIEVPEPILQPTKIEVFNNLRTII